MPEAKKKVSSKKTPAPPPGKDDPKKAAPKEPTGPIWEKKPRNFAIGGDIQVGSVPAGHLPRWRRCARGALKVGEGGALSGRSDGQQLHLLHLAPLAEGGAQGLFVGACWHVAHKD